MGEVVGAHDTERFGGARTGDLLRARIDEGGRTVDEVARLTGVAGLINLLFRRSAKTVSWFWIDSFWVVRESKRALLIFSESARRLH